jgi:putative IMPACT (imprinted ancient) family translation regulator
VKAPAASHLTETTEKRSRFIAYLLPYAEFPGMQERLKAEHPKASHVVYASRHIDEYGRVVERSGDDGEPKGCAGVPVLNAMRGAELVEAAILVVRYFGGIKLGTGGMARAYSAAARSVIDSADLRPWRRIGRLEFHSGYSAQRRILYLTDRLGIVAVRRHYGAEGIDWELEGEEETLRRFREEAGREILPKRSSTRPPA